MSNNDSDAELSEMQRDGIRRARELKVTADAEKRMNLAKAALVALVIVIVVVAAVKLVKHYTKSPQAKKAAEYYTEVVDSDDQ